MKNSLKNRKRFAAAQQNKTAKAQKRNRKGRAENDPSAFTRAQAIRRIQHLTDAETVERFTKHQNKHVVARAESKLRAIANAAAAQVELVAEVSEPLPLPDPVPVLVAEVNKQRTIKGVREAVAGVSNPAVLAAAEARIEKLRAARKARKTKAA